jgi:alcohol dehydrogenase
MSTPTTMKAVVVHKLGDPTSKEILSVDSDIPIPEPATGEVLVKVSAASINPVDWKLVRGDFPGGKYPSGFGFDVTGVIEKFGPDTTTDLKVGDAIYADKIKSAAKSGAFGEYAIVEVVAASPKPKNLDFVQAASLPLAGLTALQGLVRQGNMKQGDKVLIFGGSGGVGSLAIQMAKALGASEVTSTGSSVDTIKGFGADHVVNYKEENLMDALKGKDFDLVYDTIGGYEHWEIGQACLKKGGAYVTIAGDGGGGVPKLIMQVLWRKLMSNFGNPGYTFFLTDTTAPAVTEDMTKLTEFVEAGKVTPFLDERKFELTTESVHDLIKASMSHRAKGKLVLKVNC